MRTIMYYSHLFALSQPGCNNCRIAEGWKREANSLISEPVFVGLSLYNKMIQGIESFQNWNRLRVHRIPEPKICFRIVLYRCDCIDCYVWMPKLHISYAMSLYLPHWSLIVPWSQRLCLSELHYAVTDAVRTWIAVLFAWKLWPFRMFRKCSLLSSWQLLFPFRLIAIGRMREEMRRD